MIMALDAEHGPEAVPAGYRAVTLERVRRDGENLIIEYEGRVFGGILPGLLAEGVEGLIVPGARVLVRHYTAESGRPNQVVHMMMWHAGAAGWVDLYADRE
jgi:hypothetical protein